MEVKSFEIRAASEHVVQGGILQNCVKEPYIRPPPTKALKPQALVHSNAPKPANSKAFQHSSPAYERAKSTKDLKPGKTFDLTQTTLEQ